MRARLRPVTVLTGSSAGAILTAIAILSPHLHNVPWRMWATRLNVASPHQLFVFCAVVVVAVICVAAAVANAGNRRPGRRAGVVAVGAVAAVAVVAGSDPAHPMPPTAVTASVAVHLDVAAADKSALAGLMSYYDQDTGRWVIGTTGWWSGAVALSSMIGAERALGVHTYDRDIVHTWQVNRNFEGPDFRNAYYDDTLWWGLAWLDAYDLTHDPRYLRTAELDDQYAANSWSGTCGGGIDWATSSVRHGDQKNSITNELLIALAARLAVHTHRHVYVAQAERTWRWLGRSGMLRRDGLVADHLDAHCHPAGVPLTYTQGVILTGLSALTAATGDAAYLARARHLADASTTAKWFNRTGTLREPCAPARCGIDGATFAGAYLHALGGLNATLSDHPYTTWLLHNATVAHEHDRAVGDQYGLVWAGPPLSVNSASEATAVDLLTAAVEAPF